MRRILYVLFACLLSSCAIPAPAVRPFADNQSWILLEDMTWTIEGTKTSVTVPAGFVTDFASIPQAFWSSGLSPNDYYSRAAVIHDYLFWSQICTIDQSNRLFLIGMQESNVPKWKMEIVYAGVSNKLLGSQRAWDENKALRAKGYFKVLPEALRRPPPNLTWLEYQASLLGKVQDPKFAPDPSFCALGNPKQSAQLAD